MQCSFEINFFITPTDCLIWTLLRFCKMIEKKARGFEHAQQQKPHCLSARNGEREKAVLVKAYGVPHHIHIVLGCVAEVSCVIKHSKQK